MTGPRLAAQDNRRRAREIPYRSGSSTSRFPERRCQAPRLEAATMEGQPARVPISSRRMAYGSTSSVEAFRRRNTADNVYDCHPAEVTGVNADVTLTHHRRS